MKYVEPSVGFGSIEIGRSAQNPGEADLLQLRSGEVQAPDRPERLQGISRGAVLAGGKLGACPEELRGQGQDSFLQVLLVCPENLCLDHEAIDDGFRIRFPVRGNDRVHEVCDFFKLNAALDLIGGVFRHGWNGAESDEDGEA